MKTINIMLTLLLCLFTVSFVSAQTETVEPVMTLDNDTSVSRIVWNETSDVLTLVSRDKVVHAALSEAADTESYTLGEKAYSFTTVAETGLVAALSKDRTEIYLYEPGKGEKALLTIDPGFPMLSVFLSKDGSQVLADSGDQIRSVVYSTADGTVVHDLSGFQTAAPVYDSMLSPDGTLLVWHSRGTFAVQNIETAAFGKTISLWDFASAYEISPDNKVLAVGMVNNDYESGAVLFFDPESGEESGRAILGKTPPFDLSYSDDGSGLWAADAKTVYKLDPETFELLSQTTICDKEDDRIIRISSSPDGSSAAVLTNSGELYVVKM